MPPRPFFVPASALDLLGGAPQSLARRQLGDRLRPAMPASTKASSAGATQTKATMKAAAKQKKATPREDSEPPPLSPAADSATPNPLSPCKGSLLNIFKAQRSAATSSDVGGASASNQAGLTPGRGEEGAKEGIAGSSDSFVEESLDDILKDARAVACSAEQAGDAGAATQAEGAGAAAEGVPRPTTPPCTPRRPRKAREGLASAPKASNLATDALPSPAPALTAPDPAKEALISPASSDAQSAASQDVLSVPV